MRLFQRANGYMGTELLRDREEPHRYVTLDHWRSREAYEAFQSSFGAEYAMLDARCEAYFVGERSIGQFETIG